MSVVTTIMLHPQQGQNGGNGLRKHVARVIAKTRKEELPAKRAKELQTLFASAPSK